MPLMVRFSVGEGAWLAPVDRVLGVRRADTVRPIPDPAPGIVGVIDRDGVTVPVSRALGDGSYVLLVGTDDDRVVGVLTDTVRDVADVGVDALHPRPGGQLKAYVEATVGAGDDLAYVLDADELLRTVIPGSESDHD